MAKLKIDNKLADHLQSVHDRLFTLSAMVASDARKLAPSDTGALQRSIQRTKTRTGAAIISNVPYAPFVEFTQKPFMRPAMDYNRKTIIQAVKQHINKIK